MDNNFNTPDNSLNNVTPDPAFNNNTYAAPNADPYTAQPQQDYTAPTADPYTAQPQQNYSAPNTDPYAAQPQQNYTAPNADPYAAQPQQNYTVPNSNVYNTQQAPYQGTVENAKAPLDTLALISMICGIVSTVFAILCCCCTGISQTIALLAGIAGIVLAILSKKNDPAGKFNGMALAGLICGIVGSVFALIGFICIIANFSTMPSFSDIMDDYM